MKGRAIVLLCSALVIGFAAHLIGLTNTQAVIVAVFSLSIIGTLAFWEMRLGLLFLGTVALFLIHAVDIEHFIKFASFDVILFLIGMMLVIAMVKQSGLFNFLVAKLLTVKKLSGLKLFTILMFSSAGLSAVTGEVTSTVVMMAVIFDISKALNVSPIPLVISSVLTTNIGSASTLLGNPIGVLIALRADLSFEDFLTHALPLALLILCVTIAILAGWFRPYIARISAALAHADTKKLVSHTDFFDAKKKISIALFLSLILLIAVHRRIELMLNLGPNDLLIMLPIFFAGIALLLSRERAAYCIEHEIDWQSLLFFIFLFAQAGVIQSSGVAQFFAQKILERTGANTSLLAGAVISSTALLSGFLDNTVVVASYIPVVKNLHLAHQQLAPLWWAMLFGACLGGNLTVIGSTANIIAIGLLAKEQGTKMSFAYWLKIGAVVTVLTTALALLAIVYLPFFGE